ESEKPPAEAAIEPDLLPAIGSESGERDREGGEFDRGIEPAERMAAITAAAAAGEPAAERNQIPRAQSRPATLAARPHPGDRPSFGYAPADATEKAADKGRGEQHAPPCGTSARHPVEQFPSDHVPLLPLSDVLLYVTCLPSYSAVMTL